MATRKDDPVNQEFETLAKNLLKGELKRRGITYAQLAEKLLAAIGEPVADVPQAGRLGASIGICLFSREGRSPESPEQIIRAADQAMYQAKAAGKHRHAFARS